MAGDFSLSNCGCRLLRVVKAHMLQLSSAVSLRGRTTLAVVKQCWRLIVQKLPNSKRIRDQIRQYQRIDETKKRFH